MPRTPLLYLALSAGIAAPSLAQSAKTTLPILTPAGQIALPKVEGRMDHFAYDSKRQRLWVAALENHSVEVLDIQKRRSVTTLAGLTEPQGLVYAAQKDFVFVASRGDGTLRSFNAKTFTPGPWADLGRNTDNVRFDVKNQMIYAGTGGEPGPGFLTALELNSLLPVNRGGVAAEPRSPADIRLDQPRQADWKAQVQLFSHPESFQIDPMKGQIYVNVPDEHTVNVIKPTPQGLKITARWPVKLAKRNFPMVLDAPSSRLFVIARNPALVLTYDTNSGKCLSQIPCVGDSDDAYYDAATRRLFVIGGEGFVDVFDAAPKKPLRRLQRVKTGARARTGIYLPALRLLAVAQPHTPQHSAKVFFFHVK